VVSAITSTKPSLGALAAGTPEQRQPLADGAPRLAPE
jgi:hypothetical protein